MLATPAHLRIHRVYNSRSRYDGWFGDGWSTDFDVHLRPDPKTKTISIFTGSGFELRVNAPPGIDLTKRYENELLISPGARHRAGPRFLSWKWLVHSGEIWQGNQGRLYEKQGHLVYRSGETGNSYWWDEAGKLAKIIGRHGDAVLLRYNDRGWLEKLTDASSKNWVKFQHDDFGHVVTVRDSRGQQAHYIYSTSGDCIASRDSRDTALGFLFDDWPNMTATRYADGRTQRMQYNRKKDWIETVQPADDQRGYRLDAFSLAKDELTNQDHGTSIHAYWKGRPTASSTATYRYFQPKAERVKNRPKGEQAKKLRLVELRRQQGGRFYQLTKDPLEDVFTGLVKDGRRWILESDNQKRPSRLLKPDGTDVQFFYRGNENKLEAVETSVGRFSFQFEADGVCQKIVAPHDASFTITRDKRGRLVKVKGKVEEADWAIKVVREDNGRIVDYDLLRQGRWRTIGKAEVQLLCASKTWKNWQLDQSIDRLPGGDDSDLAFVDSRMHELFKSFSRSSINLHALHCRNCFVDHIDSDFRGLSLEDFSRDFLP